MHACVSVHVPFKQSKFTNVFSSMSSTYIQYTLCTSVATWICMYQVLYTLDAIYVSHRQEYVYSVFNQYGLQLHGVEVSF